jgi:hypothetical protein
MAITAILDPRYKMKLINFWFPLIYPLHEASMHIDNVLSVLHEMYKVYELAHNSSVIQQSAQENASSSSGFTRDFLPKIPTSRSMLKYLFIWNTLEVMILFGPLKMIWMYILKMMFTYAIRY